MNEEGKKVNMYVQVMDGNKEVWGFGFKPDCKSTQGYTSRSFGEDGTLQKVITALSLAVEQAEGELSLSPKNFDKNFKNV